METHKDEQVSKRPSLYDRSCDECGDSYVRHNHRKNAYDFVDNTCKDCPCTKYMDEWVKPKVIFFIED